MPIAFVTKNPFKIATARFALEPLGIEVEPVDLAIPEIQADDNLAENVYRFRFCQCTGIHYTNGHSILLMD